VPHLVPAEFKGTLILPDDPRYDAARRVWNGRIDRRPALIARCLDAQDVRAGLLFAREHRLPLAVRGGGHSCAGHGTCDAGVVLDLSFMKSIQVDAAAKRAIAGPGVIWGELDRATQAFGLATPGGTDSEVGIAGLTLGGGNGWLMGLHGTTSDNLERARVLTADGRLLTASADANPDLFWALRGGGGNFGIVVQFDYSLHSIGPLVMAGAVIYPWHEAKRVLERFHEWTFGALDEVTAFACLITDQQGKPVVAIAVCYAGAPDKAEASIAALRRLGSPTSDGLRMMRYIDWQRQFDAARPRGRRCAMRSHFFRALSSPVIDILIEEFGRAPSPLSAVIVEHCHGAITRVDPTETAFPLRRSSFHFEILAFWDEDRTAAANQEWLRAFHRQTAPLGSGEVYVNSLDADETGRITEAYGPNWARLQHLKAHYDPDNVFRINHNIS
jgi:FAD/FMN-containing dehydrogenase